MSTTIRLRKHGRPESTMLLTGIDEIEPVARAVASLLVSPEANSGDADTAHFTIDGRQHTIRRERVEQAERDGFAGLTGFADLVEGQEMATMYQRIIQQHLAGRTFDPRHVEAYMRLEHPTLDGLSSGQFVREVEIAVACIEADGTDNAEACARSFGL